MTYDLVSNDTGSTLRVTCKDNDTQAVINLTGATVKFRWEKQDGTLALRTATVTDAAGGIAEYKFLTGEIEAPRMKVEVEITDSSGFIVTNLELEELSVRQRLG